MNSPDLNVEAVEHALAESGVPPLVTVAEAAVVLRCTPRTVFRRVAVGLIRSRRPPGSNRRLIPRLELARYAATGGAE